MNNQFLRPDHGGNLAEARARFGAVPPAWIDLSTGINPNPYPVATLPREVWARLPDEDLSAEFAGAARGIYEVPAQAGLLAAPGASALIRLMPRLLEPGRVAIPSPTYNEHARAFEAEGWVVTDRPQTETGAMVIVNPNNPDGRVWEPDELILLADAVPLLVVDESFMDLTPNRSLVPEAGRKGLIILRSFGKFFGLAGLRLGTAIGHPDDIARLAEMLGPWPVSGPALALGARALRDEHWINDTRKELRSAGTRLVQLGEASGWRLIGEAGLFATFDVGDARDVQDRLAHCHIWSRIFPYCEKWLRLGLPQGEAAWERLTQAMRG